MEWLSLLGQLPDYGLGIGIGLAVFIAVMRGGLTSRREVDRLLLLKDQIIASEQRRADEWRTAAQASELARSETAKQTDQLLRYTEKHATVLEEIKNIAERIDRGQWRREGAT